MKEDVWAPVLRGKLYCSPGCGRGCTYAEYQHAVKSAACLSKQLGPGWKPEVWENLGWHFKATRNGCDVRQTGTEEFHANFNHRFVEYAADPLLAVVRVMTKAKKHIASLNNEIKLFEGDRYGNY